MQRRISSGVVRRRLKRTTTRHDGACGDWRAGLPDSDAAVVLTLPSPSVTPVDAKPTTRSLALGPLHASSPCTLPAHVLAAAIAYPAQQPTPAAHMGASRAQATAFPGSAGPSRPPPECGACPVTSPSGAPRFSLFATALVLRRVTQSRRPPLNTPRAYHVARIDRGCNLPRRWSRPNCVGDRTITGATCHSSMRLMHLPSTRLTRLSVGECGAPDTHASCTPAIPATRALYTRPTGPLPTAAHASSV